VRYGTNWPWGPISGPTPRRHGAWLGGTGWSEVLDRFEGSDCEIEVGRRLPHGGDLVVVILDHGREEPFVVHTRDGAQPPTRVTRPVYAVTDFS